MGDAMEDRAKARALPEGDVIRVLLEQHAQIRDLFSEVKNHTGKEQESAFDALRALLAVHETAEEMVLRPVTEKVVGEDVAVARNHEEMAANAFLAHLEKMSLDDPDFAAQFAEFEAAVDKHAEAEESEEFPRILAECDVDQRQTMGRKIKAAEMIAPTHPHPSMEPGSMHQRMVGPFAALIDRARDAISHAH
ncbi:hemerythrin domain-containing protein [Nocardioides nematodiphilus]|uniref:hemerythrin domain-containing protein n=1 Tax=Nocardioides nematodiphilus TaxID=2849669 RepID=UPI001CD9CC31|nr:hemerythrin domain-containing protein [Nocardioides nematodiphilus]MCA1983798.1 hemerythrin domain-containing protein [Nocardioides nematodiphilus]